MAFRKPGTKPNEPGWWVRVVSNKYPALAIEGGFARRGIGMFDQMNGIGAHEVIIESPSHEISLTALSDGHIETI